MRLAFADWLPDLAESDAGVGAVATNVYPALNSYIPVKGAEAYSTALAAAPRGLWFVQKESGDTQVIAGTASTMYLLDTSDLGWDSLGNSYGVQTDHLWSAVQWGTKFIAVNVTDDPQIYDIEAGGSFGALSGSPPKARFVDIVGDYVFLACLESDPYGGQWSATNDETGWTAGTGNSDVFSFPDGGFVQSVCGAASLIVQERAIRQIISQPGDPTGVFGFQKIEQAKGTIAPYSVIKYGPGVAYLSDEGFWFNGENIAHNKVWRYFLSLVNTSRLYSVLGAADPTRPVFYWAYRTGSSDLYDRVLCYDWSLKKWSEIEASFYHMSNVATPGITLEGLDALYASLEDIPYSLDSRVWQGGRPVFGVIGSDLKLSFFEGDTLEATMETGERQLMPFGRSMVRSVRPAIDASAAVARVGKRERIADTRTWGAEASMQTSGECPVRSSGRMHRFRVRVPAGTAWTHAQGVGLKFSKAGTR
jgi:hypothetical protein